MKIIPAATIVVLTPEERQVLEALAGSRKTEARMRDRARIVLLASAGTASRAIARDVGCTPGTASKWRVRYANKRMAGLSEPGDRGNEPKYGPEHGQRILALLDKPPPAGYSNWTAPLLARELADIHEQYIWRFLRAQKIDCVSAWKKDPVRGVIGVQKGPPLAMGFTMVPVLNGGLDWDAGIGDGREDPPGVFRSEENDQGDLPRAEGFAEGGAQGSAGGRP